MQFLSISDNTTLSQLNNLVGHENTDAILNVNGLKRVPKVGKQLVNKANSIINSEDVKPVNWQKKLSVLNTFTGDSDIYEYASLLGSDGWKVLSTINTFPSMLRIPESITLPDNFQILGNNQPVSRDVYEKVRSYLIEDPHEIDPKVFNTFQNVSNSSILGYDVGKNPIDWFNLPWGKISLYSSINNEYVDFPVYPETISDGVSATYDTMPDMIYQYEPWQTYQSSGPRTITYEFHMHRDMWSGNHNDGRCYDLVNFCKAQCYAEYSGAAVNTSTCTMYISGKSHLSGIVTQVEEDWGGPLGHDGWYLELTLRITMTEVSQKALNYQSVRNERTTYSI